LATLARLLRRPQRLRAGLDRLDTAIATGQSGGVRIKTRRGKPWIVVPALEVLSAPPNIDALHREVAGRNGTIDLLDVLKEAEHLSSFADELTSIASREITDPETAKRRKLLVSFALGANIGIKRIADAIDGHPADTEAADAADLRQPRGPASRDHQGGQQDARGPRRAAVRPRDGVRV